MNINTKTNPKIPGKVSNYEEPQQVPQPKGPEKKFRAGAIAATVWRNELQKDGETVSYNTISIERRYKDREGNWKSANSLRINDLPRVALLIQEAYRYCVMNELESKPEINDNLVM